MYCIYIYTIYCIHTRDRRATDSRHPCGHRPSIGPHRNPYCVYREASGSPACCERAACVRPDLRALVCSCTVRTHTKPKRSVLPSEESGDDAEFVVYSSRSVASRVFAQPRTERSRANRAAASLAASAAPVLRSSLACVRSDRASVHKTPSPPLCTSGDAANRWSTWYTSL